MEPTNISTIIDHQNKFIRIVWKSDYGDIVWKDSYRIFPVNLDKLCDVFDVKGKLSKYNPRFNNLDIFYNESLLKDFKDYALQDAIALLSALKIAQTMYLSDFNVDITSILSTSTLSLKIFRQKFLDVDIPILKGETDQFIRRGYFGGHTDYYKAYITNGYYYDVNSLYPKAMCQPMPRYIISFYLSIIYKYIVYKYNYYAFVNDIF